MILSLLELSKGGSAKIVEIGGGGLVQQKLENLGFHRGTVVKKVRGMFIHGPLIIMVGQSEVAIGRGLAKKVMVELV